VTPKQELFVAEYLATLNATEAAKRAGYSARTADRMGHENLKKPEIAAAVAAGKARQLETAELTAARVLEEIRRLSFSDMRALFDEHGNLRPIQTLTAEQASCIASLEVVKKNLTAGDGQVDTVVKLKVWDKTKSLEMLAKHFALLTERIEHSGDLKITHELPGE
jgi:phage terminase small subunit